MVLFIGLYFLLLVFGLNVEFIVVVVCVFVLGLVWGLFLYFVVDFLFWVVVVVGVGGGLLGVFE